MATPGGEFAVFAQCPLGTSGVTGCVAIHAESGEITIGKLKAPIVNPQTLQGGFIENEETLALVFVGATDGETLPRTAQTVSAGSVQCDQPRGGRWSGRKHRWFARHEHWWFERAEHRLCKAIFENNRAGLYITPELAAPASSIGLNLAAALAEQGTALSLPVKLRLENPLLGNECYIGSDTTPIVIDFTDGPAGALTGKLGQIGLNPEGTILTISGVTFVNDTFVAPEATGCGYHGWLDKLINTKLGLPAPAGTNTAILNGTHEQAGSEVVAEHDEPTTTTPQPPTPHHRR
jgi:hypothetical protein